MTKTYMDEYAKSLYFMSAKREKTWRNIAIVSLVVAGMAMLTTTMLMPLKEVEAFTIVVDKTTGHAEKVYKVKPTVLEGEDALKQAYLASYIIDRETYDVKDSKKRIYSVLKRSDKSAKTSLKEYWNVYSANHPRKVLGNDTVITVKVKSISFLNKEIAQVSFTKTLHNRQSQNHNKTSHYKATVKYNFKPRTEKSIQDVWDNPLGFQVVGYRVDADSGEN